MQLVKWMQYFGVKPKEIAEACGVVVQTVYRWRDGLRVPRPGSMAALMRMTEGKVTPLDFLDVGDRNAGRP